MARNIHTQEEIQKRLDSLPNQIRDYLYSNELDSSVQQIGQKQKLHIDQMEALQGELRQIMLGFVQTKDLSSVLIQTLGVDQSKSESIVQDIDTIIFSKIRDAMKKVYEMNKTEAPVVSAPEPVKLSVTATPAAPPMPPTPTSSNSTSSSSSTPPITVPPKLPKIETSATPQMPIVPKPPMLPTQNATNVVAPQKAGTTSALDNPAMHQADKILSQPTVSKAPTPPLKPAEKVTPVTPPATGSTSSPQAKNYTTDPYREPPNP